MTTARRIASSARFLIFFMSNGFGIMRDFVVFDDALLSLDGTNVSASLSSKVFRKWKFCISCEVGVLSLATFLIVSSIPSEFWINRFSVNRVNSSWPRLSKSHMSSTISSCITRPDESFRHCWTDVSKICSFRSFATIIDKSSLSIACWLGEHSRWASSVSAFDDMPQISWSALDKSARYPKELHQMSIAMSEKWPLIPPFDLPNLFIEHSIAWSRPISTRRGKKRCKANQINGRF